jgi:hypothetical protein
MRLLQAMSDSSFCPWKERMGMNVAGFGLFLGFNLVDL